MEEQGQVTQSEASVDWLPSLFQAIGSVFDTISTALEPTVLSAQAYFQQLLNAQAELQDPLAQVNENRRRTDMILIYAGVGIIALLIIAIVLKKEGMKSISHIVIVAAVVVGLLLLVVFLFRFKNPTAPKNENNGNQTDGDPPSGPLPCQNIPGNLPPFQNSVTPPNAKAFLSVSDVDWTPDFEARLRGFFLAVDVEPSDFTMKYFGASLIRQYLNSPDGQLPDLIVLKGSKRCGTVIATNSDDLPKPAFCINPFLTFDDGDRFSYIDVDGKRTPEPFVDDIAWNRAAIKGSFGGGRYEQHFVYNEQIADRIIGFFKATDLKITARSVLATLRKFPGQKDKNLIVEYLNSGYGGLSFNMIEKGSMRCDSGQNVVNYL